MDQGMAAVLGAAVGVTGTLGTAVLTYLATRHQVRDQGRIDHWKTLREERRAWYIDFLAAAERCSKTCKEMVDENYEPMRGGSAGFDWEGQARRVREELEGLNELRVRVQIAGPRAVSEEVDHFFEVVRDEVGKAVEGYDTRVENLNSWWEDFATLLAHEEEARYRFIAAVRDTLENPPG